jgi:hypothetical protein
MDQDPMVVAPADGVVRGDMKAMPNKGTSTGFTGVGNDRYGADVGQGANNASGSAHIAPDPMDACCPPGGGDYRSGGDGTPSSPGTGMGAAAKSDEQDETTPGDEGPGDPDDA